MGKREGSRKEVKSGGSQKGGSGGGGPGGVQGGSKGGVQGGSKRGQKGVKKGGSKKGVFFARFFRGGTHARGGEEKNKVLKSKGRYRLRVDSECLHGGVPVGFFVCFLTTR